MLLPLLALFSLPFCLAAVQSPREKFAELAAAGNGVIRIDEHTFDALTTPKRDWSVSIHFTAMDTKRKCSPCSAFDPSWNTVAKAWSKAPKKDRDNHFFATLDFDTASTVFQKLGLVSAPVVYVYPATEGPRAPANGKIDPIKYDFTHGFDAGPLAESLSNHTPVPIPYSEPIDWMRWGTFAFGALAFITGLRFISPILNSKWAWAIGTVLTSLVMTSGYMFTRIRGMPFSGPNGQWIAPGYQNQFGQETQVVAMIYGLLGTAFLMLIVVTPLQSSPARQRTQVYLWTAVIMIIYSILVAFFRVKNRGYPFKLFL